MVTTSARPYLHAVCDAVVSDWPIYAVVAVYVAVGLGLVLGDGHLALGMLGSYAYAWTIQFGVIGPVFVSLIGLVRMIHRVDGRRRLGYRAMFAPRRVGRFVAGTVLLLTALLLFMATFSSIKTGFPADRGFPYDLVQADLDKAIHFGVDPWRLLYAVAQHPLVLKVVEANYNVVWFVICYFTLYWVVTSPRTEGVRLRYVLTWMAAWIVVGNVLASAWLSAGPAFYGLVTGDTARFAEQLAFLATGAGEPHSAHNFQRYLWHLHTSGQPGIGSGISAFPSMHLALITLNALFVGEISRRWAVVMWAYVAFVQMSSVYLGWHYAIDGYASMVVVTGLYWGFRKGMPLFARLRWRSNPAADIAIRSR